VTGPLEKDVKEIRWRVEGVEKSVDLLVRANRPEIIADVMKFFGRSRDKVKVFLEVDGEKTVEAITKKLKMQKPNVSPRITELKDQGLIELKKITSQGYHIYAKTEKVKILDLERELRKKFRL
jgi:predicted transcriptional regulator